MRLSKGTHYGLLALAHLAEQREGTILASAELAERIDVSPTFLAKILQRLARAGLVRAHRGRRRGYGLTRAADSLSVREVTEAFEGDVLPALRLLVERMFRRRSLPAARSLERGAAARA